MLTHPEAPHTRINAAEFTCPGFPRPLTQADIDALYKRAVDAEDQLRREVASGQAASMVNDTSHAMAVDLTSRLEALVAERDATIAKLKEQKASIISTLADACSEIFDRKADAVTLQASLNEMHIRAVDAENAVRASVVAFLDAEATRFDAAAPLFIAKKQPGSADRCIIKAGHTRTLAAQIARGDDRNDDRNGADDAAPVKTSAKITGRLVTVGRIATCDNYSETTYGENLDIDVVSGILIVMDDDNVRAAGGLFGKVIEVRGADDAQA